MTVRRPPPGAQLSSGRIRVDAARAIAKLREYRLADPNAWILEAVRAAVGSGATRLALDGDADDVRLMWAGPAWPAETLPDLFDELVSPQATRDVYPRRLLAGAVNSGLGLEPAWVDVIAVSGGTASRVRFTPATVTPGEDGAAPLRDLEIEPCEVPEGAADPGMYVQLRRRAGLETLGRFLVGGEPPELALARWACRDIGVPLVIGGTAVGRGHHDDDLLRVPLGESLDGFVALVHPSLLRGATSVPAMDVGELGVRVVRQRWTPASLEAAWRQERAPLPVRLVVDGPRMPTNASRSQVRTDDHPVDAAMRRGDLQIAALVDELAARLAAGGADRETMRAAALALLAPAIAGADWSGDATGLVGPLAKLAKLPLVRNAVGAWRAPGEYWRDPVYRGAEPIARELSPWLGTMPWIPPGDPAALLLGASRPDARAARRAIRSAFRRLRARQAFLAQPAQEARVAPRAASRVRARIGPVLAGLYPVDVFTDLDGEVCVADAPGPGRITLHVEGRPLATRVLDTPLAVEAVVTGARLMPDERYRGVVIDGELRRAERAAKLACVLAIAALADERAHPGVEVSAPRRAAGDDQLLRIALAMARDLGMKLDDDSPLAQADVFADPDGRPYSLARLRRERAIALAAPGVDVVPPAGRLVVVAAPAETKLLATLVGPETAVVRYDARHARPLIDPGLSLARMIAGRTGTAALVRREGVLAGAVGFEPPAGSCSLATYHRGERLDVVARQAAHVDCSIAIDSEAIVPDEGWRAVRDDGGLERADLTGWEVALVRAAVRALLGDPEPDLVIPRRPIRIDDLTGWSLCKALGENDPEELLGAELVARMRGANLWPVLHGDGAFSIDRLRGAFGDDIPAIAPESVSEAREIEGWHPLVGDEVVRSAVARLSGRKVADATAEIARHKKAALRRRKLAEHRQRPLEPMELLAAPAAIALPGELRGLVAAGEDRRLEVIVLVEGRRFTRITSSPDLPLRAVVELAVDAVDLERGEVGSLANGRVLAAVRAAAGPWLAHIAKQQPETLADGAAARALLAAWIETAGDGHEAVREALRSARAWPTIQGERASLSAAAHGPTVATAAWSGDWLAGDPADPLDGPVIAIPEGGDGDAFRAVLDAIGPWPTDDVTGAVRRLQARRRVLSGKVRAPTVEAAVREVTRRIEELDVHHTLGAGEIALDNTDRSLALLHFDGEHRESLPIDVVPAVRIAIEAPELVDAMRQPGGLAAAHKEQLARQVQALALALVTQVASAATHGAALPPWLRRRLAHALLAQRLDPERVAALPLFVTATGDWLSWNDLLAQERMLGDVWFVSGEPATQPLDDRRKVLALAPDDAALASRLTGVTFLDGSRELALDAQARANRARPPLPRLELPPRVRGAALAIAELTTTAARRRGVVATLRPDAVAHRGLDTCRQLVPFERASDPCAWPTYAIVEDPELQGDRTWCCAAKDATWSSLADDVRATSEAALRGWLAAPADALTSELVDAWENDRGSTIWENSLVRGVLWIDARARDPRARGLVTVSTAHGDIEIDAPPEAPLWGKLYAAPEPHGLVEAVKTLCRARHDAMARRAGVWREREQEQEQDAQGVYGGSRSTTRRGAGLYREPPSREAMPEPAREWLPDPRPRPQPPAAPTPPPHRLQPLVDAVRARLEAGAPIGVGTNMKIEAARTEPAVHARADRLIFAGKSELLVAVLEGREDRAPWAAGAIDAIAAHCMTLLNQTRAPVDDSHERLALQFWLETR